MNTGPSSTESIFITAEHPFALHSLHSQTCQSAGIYITKTASWVILELPLLFSAVEPSHVLKVQGPIVMRGHLARHLCRGVLHEIHTHMGLKMFLVCGCLTRFHSVCVGGNLVLTNSVPVILLGISM